MNPDDVQSPRYGQESAHPPDRRRGSAAGRWFGALATLLSMSLLLAAWVGLFAFLGVNSAYGTFEGLKDDWCPTPGRWSSPSPTCAGCPGSTPSRRGPRRAPRRAQLRAGALSGGPQIVVNAILAAEDSELLRARGRRLHGHLSAALENSDLRHAPGWLHHHPAGGQERLRRHRGHHPSARSTRRSSPPRWSGATPRSGSSSST